MPGKIFVSYRRDDERSMAARIRDRLAATFGDADIFMDIDNLLAGQRFDRELDNALDQTDVLLAVIGPRWMELLAERQAGRVTDYVRKEIAGALQRGITVIPVLIDRTPLPQREALPGDIRDLVLHQRHVVTHEQFGRDVAGLVEAIQFGRSVARAEAGAAGANNRWVATALVVLMLGGGVLASQLGSADRRVDVKQQGVQAAKTKAVAEKVRQREEERKGAAESPAAKKTDGEARAQEPERRRLALLKTEKDRTNGARKPAAVDLLQSGRVFRDCPDVCPEMVVLPAGEFMMGSSHAEIAALIRELGRNDPKSEGPRHKVRIARPFAVGKFEVTFAEWDACVAAGGCKHKPKDLGWGRSRRPVIAVSWQDAKQYAAWLSRKTGQTYRLLTEAEWEYAARAGTTMRYSFGDRISKADAQYATDRTVEVGSFPANAFGLHDMHGNVWEWCEDNMSSDYRYAAADGSAHKNTFWDGMRVTRGGSWFDSGLDHLRSASRLGVLVGKRSSNVGFRLYRVL